MGDLAELVRELRLRAGLTQESLAERCGVSVRTIRSMETGTQRSYHLASVRRLADGLALSPQEHDRLVMAVLDSARPAAASVSAVPRQLPAAPPRFTGRARELTDLTGSLDTQRKPDPTARVCVISGPGGVGKTSLALHWARHHIDWFPDGQLFVNLRGFDPSADPMAPETAVRVFLQALGVAPGAIPTELDAQVGLYRSLLAGKQMLILADNAADAAQVEPLLPGSPTTAVLITSRNWLPGLLTTHGAHPLPLDVLAESDATALLADRLGVDRLAAEPDAVDELVAYCAGLPLALSVIAGRAQTQPQLALTVLATEFRDTGLSALEDADPTTSLPSVLSWSYRTLPDDEARAFRLLGIAPGPDIGSPAAANLIGLPISRTRQVLRGLERASLLSQDATGRYRMHDLVRQYARWQANRTPSESDQHTAMRRLVDFYLHTAYTGDRLLTPYRPSIHLDPPMVGCVPYPLTDDHAALRWFDVEHSCLLACQHEAAARGWHQAVWQLAWALNRFHYRRGCLHDDVVVAEAALPAATHLDEPGTRATVHHLLGLALARIGRDDEGQGHLEQALSLAERSDDRLQQAGVHYALAVLWGWRGDDEQALRHITHTLSLYQELNLTELEGDALNSVGWHEARLGQYDRARTHCEAALLLQRQQRNDSSEAITLDSLGYIDFHTGNYTNAVDHYRQAVSLLRGVGDLYQLAETLEELGHPHVALGQYEQASAVWREALEVYQAQHRLVAAERVQQRLETLGETCSQMPPEDRSATQ
ncbi:tetratricopeptide repeat protein [Kutzneria buriramensis]|uniref:NB-ARC domain-containing protein n=1 Tax=Kutzneria buriramensis TaxID=1045776 RepID=A0A3E0G436_9PSEU|nr:tetratricopeptide repeat protein [Kutzneria buriramensis]REH17426.1 NB-ARC domain-containing protein [Kutzneria buriramensis]